MARRFGRQRLLQRRHQLHRAKRVARRFRQCQLRARRQISRPLGAAAAGASIRLHYFVLPIALPFDIAGLDGRVKQSLPHLDGVGHRSRIVAHQLLQHGRAA